VVNHCHVCSLQTVAKARLIRRLQVNQGRMSLKQLVFFGCISALCANPKVAFSQDQEFTLGMTFDSAKKLVEGRGTRLIGVNSLDGLFTVGEPGESQGTVQFCKGRLFLRSESIAGGIDGFAERLERFGREYGYPKVGARSGHTNTGFVSEVSMEWELEGAIDLRLSIISVDGRVSTNVLHSAQKAICK
jgi:hypothetical protein